MTSGYDLVRVTLGQITHSARLYANDGRGFTVCGKSSYLDQNRIYSSEVVFMGLAPNVDCMTCLVEQARREESNE